MPHLIAARADSGWGQFVFIGFVILVMVIRSISEWWKKNRSRFLERFKQMDEEYRRRLRGEEGAPPAPPPPPPPPETWSQPQDVKNSPGFAEFFERKQKEIESQVWTPP